VAGNTSGPENTSGAGNAGGSTRPRRLGVVEALVAARDQCPNGTVRSCAEAALEAVKTRHEGILREQAWFVLSATQGWRGERAAQVRESLRDFLEERGPKGGGAC